MKVLLTVIKGPGAGETREFSTPQNLVIGRAMECDWRLPADDPYVSRQHVCLEIAPPCCKMNDLVGSTNRPHLNGKPVTVADLNDGDVLELGYTQFLVRIDRRRPKLAVRDCRACGRAIEYWPGETIPHHCAECATPALRSSSARWVMVTCPACGCDLSPLANSDGRAAELSAVAQYSCARCVPRDSKCAGRTIDAYEVLRELGKGGMGEVFLVHHAATARIWALKQLTELHDPDLNKRFVRGMRLHRGLSHANIVRCHDAGLDAAGRAFVITQYIPGGELGEAADIRKPLPPAIAVRLICGVLDGLEHLHAAQIIHRDIKPPNILVDRPLLDASGRIADPLPTPKLADFDLAKCYGVAGGTRITRNPGVIGTLMYMPPEQVRDFANIREPADLYAVGVTLYYLMTCRYTFNFPTPADVREAQRQQPTQDWQDSRRALQMLMRYWRVKHPYSIILNEQPIPIRERDGSIPVQLAAVVDRAVRKDAELRFQTASELRDALLEAI